MTPSDTSDESATEQEDTNDQTGIPSASLVNAFTTQTICELAEWAEMQGRWLFV
jgi:hypothetical protein